MKKYIRTEIEVIDEDHCDIEQCFFGYYGWCGRLMRDKNGDLEKLTKDGKGYLRSDGCKAAEVRDHEFVQGYACAVATLIRLNEGATTDVKELFRGGLNMDTLDAHGVDEDDIRIFKKYQSELE